MSDTWYRTPLPPYEDWQGNLWTLDGQCLNPMLGPERPPVAWEDLVAEVRTEVVRSFCRRFPSGHRSLIREYMANWVRTGVLPWEEPDLGVSPLDGSARVEV